ncbi:hypothetical protein BDV12DRAFT_200279 [Aspergillus spectabilis]
MSEEECWGDEERVEIANVVGENLSSSTVHEQSTPTGEPEEDTDRDGSELDEGDQAGTSIGLKVGLGVGIPVAVVLVGAGYLIWRKYRNRSLQGIAKSKIFDQKSFQPVPQELGANGSIGELQGWSRPSELAGHGRWELDTSQASPRN